MTSRIRPLPKLELDIPFASDWMEHPEIRPTGQSVLADYGSGPGVVTIPEGCRAELVVTHPDRSIAAWLRGAPPEVRERISAVYLARGDSSGNLLSTIVDALPHLVQLMIARSPTKFEWLTTASELRQLTIEQMDVSCLAARIATTRWLDRLSLFNCTGLDRPLGYAIARARIRRIEISSPFDYPFIGALVEENAIEVLEICVHGALDELLRVRSARRIPNVVLMGADGASSEERARLLSLDWAEKVFLPPPYPEELP